jgi:hypothetical protein
MSEDWEPESAKEATARKEEGHTMEAELVSVRKIWDRALHNAFTDLIRFQGHWFCVFREGQAHEAHTSIYLGKVRVAGT